MEINGIANIKIAVQLAIEENTECHTSIDPDLASKLLKQLDYLERYMLHYAQTTRENEGFLIGLANQEDATSPTKLSAWHEVTANPNQYPNMMERFQLTVDEE
jgi:hypothetical protein